MGYYTFVDNAVPTSSQWNANFRDQVITQCTSATRPGSPVEGQHIYETDTDRVYYYSGAAWVIITEPAQSWTPTLTQSVTITTTVTRAWSRRQNGLFEAHATLTCTSAGTAANGIVLTTPYTLANTEDVGGNLTVSASTLRHAGVDPLSTTTVRFVCEAASSVLGVNPAYTIANTNVLRVHMFGRYA